jgi:hypothetical protein
MTAHTLQMYFHSIGGQQNHIHDIVLFEFDREPQQNILFHIYIYIYLHLYDNMGVFTLVTKGRGQGKFCTMIGG